MANVDKCVREAELAICENMTSHINNILAISNNERTKCFRNKNHNDIENILINFKTYIQEKLKEKYGIQNAILNKSENSNFEKGDLYCLNDNERIDIEIKFGNETNSNIGMRVFEKIFGCNLFKEALNLSERKKWINELIKENLNESIQITRLCDRLNEYISIFNSSYNNKYLNDEQSGFLENNIINNSGSSKKLCKNYLKFVYVNNKYNCSEPIIFQNHNWRIEPIKYINNQNKRLKICLINDLDEKIYFTLNWKNNYKIKGVGEISAKCGLGCPSWNINVGKVDIGKDDDEDE